MADPAFEIANQISALKVELAETRQTAATLRERDDERLITIEAAIAELEDRMRMLAAAHARVVADILIST